jgi:hypothetical protein
MLNEEECGTWFKISLKYVLGTTERMSVRWWSWGGATGNPNPFYTTHWSETCHVKHTDALVQEHYLSTSYELHLPVRRFQYGSNKSNLTN